MEKYGKIKLVNGVSVVINFVICEDEKDLRENNKKEIVKFMMNYDIDYKIHEYSTVVILKSSMNMLHKKTDLKYIF